MSYETYQMASTSAAQRVKHNKTGKYGIPKVILDCNPRGPRHWLHQLFIDQIEPTSGRPLKNVENFARLHWSAYDNKENVPAEFLRELENLPTTMKLRMLDGIWASSEGLVYSEYDSLKHIKEKEYTDYNQFIICCDIGFTAKTAIYVIGYNDDNLHVYQEIYSNNLTPTDIVEKIKVLQGIYPNNKVVIDKSAKGTITQAESMGVNVIISNSDIEGGILRLKELLIKNKITFSRNCEGLLAELDMYSYKDGTDKPEDKNNDALDSLRYGVNLYYDSKGNIISPNIYFTGNEDKNIEKETEEQRISRIFEEQDDQD
jgi:PBSX family phage terminase large subunit